MKNIFLIIGILSSISLYAQDLTDEVRIIEMVLLDDSDNELSSAQNKSSACSNTSEGTIGLADCGDVGTAAFGTAGITDAFDDEGGFTSPGPPCGGAVNDGSWHVYDLDAGVEQVMIDYAGGFAGAGGFSDMYMSFYQGPDCSSLTNVDCGIIIEKVAGSLVLHDLSISGLDDSQQLWVFTFASKGFDIDFTLTGLGAAPSNESCASAINSGTGCNLGASGATFTTPGAAGQSCSGGSWGSNENTVFYTFTATSTVGSVDIENLICNDGTAGNAQVGVWTDCAALGTYGADFYGCAVGTGVIVLPSLTIGDSYIIAVDGFAGDACTWDFLTTGVLLNVEIGNLKAYTHERGYNVIEWTTNSEVNNSHFILERSGDGMNWSEIVTLEGLGNSSNTNEYSYNDLNANSGVNYYRLSQVDYDGESREIEVLKVDNSDNSKEIFKITNLMGQEVDSDYIGLRVILYTDGTSEKVMGRQVLLNN